MVKDSIDTSNVEYTGKDFTNVRKSHKSISTIGIDTEAYKSGKCFMICTSLGDIFRPKEIPQVFFTRRYTDKKFIAYNLKYDESALLQKLPLKILQTLRQKGKVSHRGYTYRFISYKFLSIRHNNHTVTFYDLYGFFHGSLESNAIRYLGKKKNEIETKTFSYNYVRKNWERIAEYCIQDAVLVADLAKYLIVIFESFGVYPKKLYSTAYVTYQYFREKTKYITVAKLWESKRFVLDYAMRSYNGGKFEVTKKCYDYLYEYDIMSAYPYEIANLVDISDARIIATKHYVKDAVYGFIDCTVMISPEIFSPLPLKIHGLCFYPCGPLHRTITKAEYEYMISQNCEIIIHSAVWLMIDKIEYPYRGEINNLVHEKQKYKKDKDSLEYHTVKILLNSLYGKFVQLVPGRDKWIASTCWNPIYGSIITANTRIKVSRMQQKYDSIIAVHTDSIISTKPLPIEETGKLGDFSYVTEGKGIMLGCGIYQIGDETKLRGFPSSVPLTEICKTVGKYYKIERTHVMSWRECAWRGHNTERINRFEQEIKLLKVDFDRKRIWENDYQSFHEVFLRSVSSEPFDADLLLLSAPVV